MACYYPLDAWQRPSSKEVFFKNPNDGISRYLRLPCGQCIGCRLKRSRDWAMRCMHERQMHESACFITLTYSPEHLPQYGNLVYSHFQKFLKRLRKKMGKFRYYMCGEYGENFSRPHFHACIFGIDFPDRLYFKSTGAGYRIDTSKVLSECWPYGYASVGNVTFESAAYVARYVMKKVTGEKAFSHYLNTVDRETGEIFSRPPEFTRMSLKPGIGYEWFKKYKSDVYPHDYIVINGMKVPPSRYYDKLFAGFNPDDFDVLRYERERKAVAFGSDNTYDRLRVREVVTRARLKFKVRNLE